MARIYGNTYTVCVPSFISKGLINIYHLNPSIQEVATGLFLPFLPSLKKFNEMARIYGNIYVVYVPFLFLVIRSNLFYSPSIHHHKRSSFDRSLPIIKKVLHEMARIYGNTYIVCVPSSISREWINNYYLNPSIYPRGRSWIHCILNQIKNCQLKWLLICKCVLL